MSALPSRSASGFSFLPVEVARGVGLHRVADGERGDRDRRDDDRGARHRLQGLERGRHRAALVERIAGQKRLSAHSVPEKNTASDRQRRATSVRTDRPKGSALFVMAESIAMSVAVLRPSDVSFR